MTGRETQEHKLEIVKYEKEISIHAASQKTGREYVNGFKLNRN